MQQQKRNVTRMISLILAEEIFSLFLIMFMGYAVVHWGLLHAGIIVVVNLLATCTPSASTITQMAQIYGKDADYASAINVVTTLLCIFTMPLMVALYQL